MGTAVEGAIRVGVGGWTFEPWRGIFYPDGLSQKGELGYASRKLTSIEINGTYYRSQKPETFAKWHDETPDGFVFSVKAPRFATNRKVLADAGGSVARFFASGVTALKDKLGPINWQLMPSKKFEPADFEGFLKLLPRESAGRALRHAVEVRHDSFQCADVVELAREYGVGIVIAGDSIYPQIADPTAAFVYVRIMGTQPSEKCGYPETDLKLWASRAQAWAAGALPSGLNYVTGQRTAAGPRDVYLYVISGHKEHNPAAAVSLMRHLGEAVQA